MLRFHVVKESEPNCKTPHQNFNSMSDKTYGKSELTVHKQSRGYKRNKKKGGKQNLPFLVTRARKLKIQVGSVGRQLVREGSLFNNNDIFLESYFLFEVILNLEHYFFLRKRLRTWNESSESSELDLVIHLQRGLCYRNLNS